MPDDRGPSAPTVERAAGLVLMTLRLALAIIALITLVALFFARRIPTAPATSSDEQR